MIYYTVVDSVLPGFPGDAHLRYYDSSLQTGSVHVCTATGTPLTNDLGTSVQCVYIDWYTCVQ